MLTYKAMYKFLEHSVHAEVLDFPGTITVGDNLQEARRLLASALVDMAETALLRGEPLPQLQISCVLRQPERHRDAERATGKQEESQGPERRGVIAEPDLTAFPTNAHQSTPDTGSLRSERCSRV